MCYLVYSISSTLASFILFDLFSFLLFHFVSLLLQTLSQWSPSTSTAECWFLPLCCSTPPVLTKKFSSHQLSVEPVLMWDETTGVSAAKEIMKRTEVQVLWMESALKEIQFERIEISSFSDIRTEQISTFSDNPLAFCTYPRKDGWNQKLFCHFFWERNILVLLLNSTQFLT